MRFPGLVPPPRCLIRHCCWTLCLAACWAQLSKMWVGHPVYQQIQAAGGSGWLVCSSALRRAVYRVFPSVRIPGQVHRRRCLRLVQDGMSAEHAALCRKTVPFLCQALRQGFQDLGLRSIPAAHAALPSGQTLLEARSSAAQAEGNIHDMHSFNKVRW